MQNATETTIHALRSDTYRYKNVRYRHTNIFGLPQYFINNYYLRKLQLSLVFRLRLLCILNTWVADVKTI